MTLPSPANTPEPAPIPDAPPPILGSWRNLYLLVVFTLAVLVALFTAITHAYT